jgi:hypothetical protein
MTHDSLFTNASLLLVGREKFSPPPPPPQQEPCQVGAKTAFFSKKIIFFLNVLGQGLFVPGPAFGRGGLAGKAEGGLSFDDGLYTG